MGEEAELLQELRATATCNVFVMMRYTNTPQHALIEETIRRVLAEHGLIARLAKDCFMSDDLWENLRIYMEAAEYGIAVFDAIEQQEYNPNVSLELGFMYARNKRCLLLKDLRMPRLPTDTCGKIYRDFDAGDAERSLGEQVERWCQRDLALKKQSSTRHSPVAEAPEYIVYDSVKDGGLARWSMFDTSEEFLSHIQLGPVDPKALGAHELVLSSDGSEAVGIHLKVDILRGVIEVDYCAMSSSAAGPNMYIAAIPMRAPFEDLIEVGANCMDEPENETSPDRVRTNVPRSHIGDERWHTLRLSFDFGEVPDAAYTACAIRINEGCPRRGAARLRLRRVQVTTPDPFDPRAPPRTAR